MSRLPVGAAGAGDPSRVQIAGAGAGDLSRAQIAGAVTLVLLTGGVFAASCLQDARIPFLVRDESAPWIMAPWKPTGLLGLAERDALPVTSFRRRFEIAGSPPGARLRARALRELHLRLNGRPLEPEPQGSRHWRVFGRFDLAGALRPGSNELRAEVTNATGPALLALRLEGLPQPLTTGPAWEVSVEGGPWRPAVPLRSDQVNPSSYAMPRPGEAAAARAGTLLALAALSLLLFGAARTPTGRRLARAFRRALPFVIAGIWLAFLVRSLEVPLHVGFDAHHHVDYVDFLREHRSLPVATDGWMMFQPPAYYVPTALLVSLQERIAPGGPPIGWKLLGWLAGLGTALACGALARELFGAGRREAATNRAPLEPGRREAALALGFAALVPMNIYISSYVTNESLHTALACGVAWQSVRLLRQDEPSTRGLLGWAALLALAVLTKYTAWIVGCVAGFFLVVRWLRVERAPAGVVARRVGVAAAVVLGVAGWFYARNLAHFGQPFPLNVDLPGETKQWWAQPGYYTSDFFLSFGGVLAHPFLAGFHSAWDAFYSTLWGDGQLGGQVVAQQRHPHWDWELMATAYWLALPATALLALGGVRSLRLALRERDPGLRAAHSFLLTLAWALLVSVLYMTLRQQDYGQAKAFYAMAAIAPLSVFFALGTGGVDRWLEQRGATWARALLYAWLGTFAGVVIQSFAG